MEKLGIVEDGFITFVNAKGVKVEAILLKSSNNNIVFEIYNPYLVVQLSEVINNLTICRFSETVYVGKAVVSNLINTGLFLIVSATLVDPWIENIKSSNFFEIEDEAEKFISEWNHLNNDVLPDYQLIVNKIRSFLTNMSRWLRQFDNVNNKDFENHDLIERIAKPLLTNLAGLFFKFESEAQKIDRTKIDVCKRFAQQELHPLIMQSPFAHRTFHKPLGYAGDYEMVNMMFRNNYEGETSYAKIFNAFLLGPGPAESHRNRIEILIKKIAEVAENAKNLGYRAKIFNFACGPAIELQRFIAESDLSDNCDFVLLDFSEETLNYTSNILEKIKIQNGRQQVTIKTIHKSVNEVLRSAVGLPDSDFDKNDGYYFVYCAGLFDYLSDRICAKLLELFFSQLKIGGKLLATNVHPNNPAIFLMEHLLEWHLIYRDEKKFVKLLNVENKLIYTDQTGFNIFLEVNKNS